MALAAFLDKYDTVLFDMDGVITSEQNYWTVAALTVWEWLHKDEGLSVEEMAENAAKIRAEVFCDDKLISILKGKGVNSNWDLGYVVYGMCRILDTHDFVKVMHACESFSDNILDEYPIIADRLTDITGVDCSRNEKLWTDMVFTFQEWFLGDELFRKTFGKEPQLSGKKGLVYAEKPIIDNDVLNKIFDELTNAGKRLATATGRPSNELIAPLESFGILDKFAADGVINYDHVQNAERNLGINLTKPHPYIFVKAMLGETYPDEIIASGRYDKSKINRTLVVGDAGADILAAKAMGADFCTVLTGVSGESARPYFEKLESEYILPSLADFLV